MHTIKSALDFGKQSLLAKGIEDPKISAMVLLKNVLKCNDSYLFAHPEKELTQEQQDLFAEWIKERSTSKPIAYIIGKKEFYGFKFFVNPNVLIPRPETELIVDYVIQECSENQIKTLVDVGTGSGILAVVLKKLRPQFNVFAVDIDASALEVAGKNARQHNTEITFLQSDLLENVTMNADIIVSNLPYVENMTELSLEVLHEPKLALDGGKSGLEIIYRLIDQANSKLNNQGLLILEYGIGQTQAIVSQLNKKGYTLLQVIPDLAGIDRVIVAKKE